MANKQILAALQIESNEVRLIVGEIFNTRLNTLKRECVPCKGMDGLRIVDPKTVAKAVREAANNIQSHFGVAIESVLLAIPAYRFKKETRSFSKVIDNVDGKISADDIRDIYQKALAVNVGRDYEIVNVTSNMFKTNGIVYRKMPIGEPCDVLEADVDLLCCDKMTTYDYASVVELAGLKIVDVCLDNYALCKEAALFEQNLRNYTLLIQMEKDHSQFSLVYDGKIAISENENLGYSTLSRAISERFRLPDRHSSALLLKHDIVNRKEFNYRPIYSWTAGGITNTISDRELYDSVQEKLQYLVKDFSKLCGPILARENTSVIICGDGAEITGIEEVFANKFNRPVKCYYPETLGARGAKWAVDLGMFYAYIDQQVIHQDFKSSLDILHYQQNMRKRVHNAEKEEGFTARLKKMLFTNQKN
ncbi:MAG: hypothetical protein E7187_05545 [Erysipelotrichaceae bacterium]|nr:hypothetical protein [Erysipelotrichaceae bacterium]MBR2701593.1 hypothetical protein [Erysipelotrichaceae bacterium]MBR2745883.1 hypothetical protein [Erysipelotrichaceae bacterium]